MVYGHLIVNLDDDGICYVNINRKEKLNALNKQTMLELQYVFAEWAPKLPELGGIILTGAGEKAFVAGADIKEFLGLDVAKGSEMSKLGQDIFFLIERFPKPVIAAVKGFALGGGCELAMACHMRIAGENAKFGQPEVNLGIIPGYGGTQRLIQHIGKGKAIELMMTGDMIGAEEAYRLGLVNHVVPAGEEVAKAKEILHKIISKAPVAISKVIECVNTYFDKNTDGFAFESSEFGATTGTEDFKEGAAAFMERRKAEFKGR